MLASGKGFSTKPPAPIIPVSRVLDQLLAVTGAGNQNSGMKSPHSAQQHGVQAGFGRVPGEAWVNCRLSSRASCARQTNTPSGCRQTRAAIPSRYPVQRPQNQAGTADIGQHGFGRQAAPPPTRGLRARAPPAGRRTCPPSRRENRCLVGRLSLSGGGHRSDRWRKQGEAHPTPEGVF